MPFPEHMRAADGSTRVFPRELQDILDLGLPNIQTIIAAKYTTAERNEVIHRTLDAESAGREPLLPSGLPTLVEPDKGTKLFSYKIPRRPCYTTNSQVAVWLEANHWDDKDPPNEETQDAKKVRAFKQKCNKSENSNDHWLNLATGQCSSSLDHDNVNRRMYELIMKCVEKTGLVNRLFSKIQGFADDQEWCSKAEDERVEDLKKIAAEYEDTARESRELAAQQEADSV